jgi:putative ATPase
VGTELLNIFELVVNASNEDEILITNDLVFPSNNKIRFYMIKLVQHYDIVSAFIKSIRSDPNGAVYWLNE